MFGWGIGFIAIGVLSFVIPMLGRQFILVTLLGLTGIGSAVAGLLFIGLGIALISIASKRLNHESPNMGSRATESAQQPRPSMDATSRDIWFIHQTELLLAALASVIDVKSTAIEMFKATKKSF